MAGKLDLRAFYVKLLILQAYTKGGCGFSQDSVFHDRSGLVFQAASRQSPTWGSYHWSLGKSNSILDALLSSFWPWPIRGASGGILFSI